MRYLGIDYGRVRTGAAVSNDEETLAFPITVLVSLPEEKLFQSLSEIINIDGIKTIVLGLPFIGENVNPSWKKEVEAFAERLKTKLGIEVILENEMFTTRIAERSSPDNADAAAAALILQSFLDRKNKV